jgi:maltooligosyltrehalose trehalohydrolase
MTSPGRYRAMTALWLLSPQTPMFFQGQEFAAGSPSLYFNDCEPDERRDVRRGRFEFLAQFPSLATSEAQSRLPDPCDPATFDRSKLNHAERLANEPIWNLHRDLLRLRRLDPVLSIHDARYVHGTVLGEQALVLRFLPPSGQTRLLIVNFGAELRAASLSTPLVAPPEGARWKLLWSSECPRYGRNSTPPLETPAGWRLPAESAILLEPAPLDEAR